MDQLDPFKNYLFDTIGAMDGRDLAKEDTYEGDLTLENADILAFWKWEESRQERGRYLLNSWISRTPGMEKTPSWGYLPIPPGSTGSKLPQAVPGQAPGPTR